MEDIKAQRSLRKKSPYDSCFCPCRLSYEWLTLLLFKGWWRPLEFKDIPTLPKAEVAETLYKRFDNAWQRHKASALALILALHRAFGLLWWFGGLLMFISSCMTVAQPIIVQFIIRFLYDPEIYKCCVLVAALFVSMVIQNWFAVWYNHIAMLTSLRINSVMTNKLYEKALSLSTKSRSSISNGEIVNLLSVDVQKVAEACQLFFWGACGFLQIFACLGLLYYLLGWVMFVSVGVMLLTLPIQVVILSIFSTARSSVLKYTDLRIKTINEILQGIRIIKFFSWEDSYSKRVTDYRNKEVFNYGKLAFLDVLIHGLMMGSPLVVAISTFIVYGATVNWNLDPTILFPALAFLNVLRFPLTFLPFVVILSIQGLISVKRLQRFFIQEEHRVIPQGNDSETPIKVTNGNFEWEVKEEEPEKEAKKSFCGCCGGNSKSQEKIQVEANNNSTDNNDGKDKPPSATAKKEAGKLSDINFSVKKGNLCIIVGAVGSGKSSLLHSIIADMKTKEGSSVEVTGSIAYCSQQAWIQNATLQDNITFGLPMDREKYETVLDVCCLKRDLELLPSKDMTEIGERGINLSGGQRQRTSLARAVYSNRDIYLLDDITSAVDAHVGRYIFENCIMGYLKNKTRLFVTHQLQYLSYADQILVMNDGKIIESGSYAELMKIEGGQLRQLIEEHTVHDEKQDGDEKKQNKKEQAHDSADSKEKEKSTNDTNATAANNDDDDENGKLMQNEERSKGLVSVRVLWNYISKMGGPLVIILILSLFLLTQGGLVLTDWWLSQWSSNAFPNLLTGQYIGIYCGIGAAGVVFLMFRDISIQFFSLLASTRLHAAMFKRVIRAPMSFFDTTPIGRILSRFSKDQENADSVFIAGITQSLSSFFQVLGALAVMAYASYWFLIPMVPIVILYLVVVSVYRSNIRELKRLNNIVRSPLYAFFSESLSGVSTIRSYDAEVRFKDTTTSRIDDYLSVMYIEYMSRQWMQMRLDMFGSLLVCASGFLIIAIRNVVPLGVAGLGFSYGLQVTTFLSWAVFQLAEAEANFSCIERITFYGNKVPNEAPAIIKTNRPPQNWPDKGVIKFNSFSMRYREELPLVLNQLNMEIRENEKIGIVGRTGSGKSSLMLSLYRIIEAAEGSIVLDGIDISTIGLSDLRRKLSIIPQEPTLFSGTVRSNLDPFHEYTDDHLWKCLEQAHMKKDIEALKNKLLAPVEENGSNFSVGQRQLLCLARALTKQAKVMFLDEATANVDFASDALIQKTVREAFNNCTRLTIAHRLNTIIDCDRILVLEKGRIAEFDTPAALLSNPDSILTSMVNETGAANAALLKRIALGEEAMNIDELVKVSHQEEEQLQASDEKNATQEADVQVSLVNENQQQELTGEASNAAQEDSIVVKAEEPKNAPVAEETVTAVETNN